MCDFCVCFNVGGIFVVVECSLLILSGCYMLCKRVEWICGILLFFSDFHKVSGVCVVVVCLFCHANVGR